MSMRRRHGVLLFTAVLLPLGVLTAPGATAGERLVGDAHASGSDAGSHIVWTRVLDDEFTTARIMASDPDGRHAHAVSHPAAGEFDIDATISPDGRWVVFERDRLDGSVASVVADIDGHHERELDLGCTDPCVLMSAPSWTPDGRHLAFTPVVGPFDQVNGSARSAVLYTARLDGSHRTRLSPTGIDGAYEDYRARYSPDGKWLTFVRVRNSDISASIWVMRSDGTHAHRVTPWSLGGDVPDFSPATYGPTKGLIVFETYGMGAPPGFQQDIATVPYDCETVSDCTKKIRYVTHNGAGPRTSFNPAWSPDGRRIAFFDGEFSDTAFVGDIWTIRPDGTGRRPVNLKTTFDFRPDWG